MAKELVALVPTPTLVLATSLAFFFETRKSMSMVERELVAPRSCASLIAPLAEAEAETEAAAAAGAREKERP